MPSASVRIVHPLTAKNRMVFSDPEEAGEDGLVSIGVPLETKTLIEAYTRGIFPWPHKGYPMLWFSPPRRAIWEYAQLKIPRSLARRRRQNPYHFTMNRAFKEVIACCQYIHTQRAGGTWITDAMRKAYLDLHVSGLAHSVEAWDGDGKLAGGVYGVSIQGTFSAESMFFVKADASKLALLFLIEELYRAGLEWLDIQMLTPHMEGLGAREISRTDFLKRLRAAQRRNVSLFKSNAWFLER